MTLHLIRHGMTAANEKRLYCGQTDIPLSEAGRCGLLELRKSIRYPAADICIVSGLLRCAQTADILYANTPRYTLEELGEISFGDFEMRGHRELETLPEYQNWIADIENAAPPNGESKPEFRGRVEVGLLRARQLCGQNAAAAVVVHGGVTALLMEMLFPRQRSYYDWLPDFGRGYTVTCEDGGGMACSAI